ncbi:MAG: Mur ligase family protein [Patulibacter sp.]
MVAGLGRAGTAAAQALAAQHGGDAVRVWDGLDRPFERERAGELARLGIETLHDADGIAVLDAVPSPRTLVKSPGLSAKTPIVADARRRGLAVIDEAELGWLLDERPLVAVTGTNGKSTTTSLVSAVLATAGRAPVAAGNTMFGVPYSATPEQAGDVIVAELSSFQLEACPSLRPDAAVLTNLTPDHLYRHGSFAEYARCKRRLLIGDDHVVPVAAVGVDQPFGRELVAALRDRGATVVSFGRHPTADRRVLSVEPVLGGGTVRISEGSGARTLELRLTGAHNALNAAGALALADALAIPSETATTALADCQPLPGRFESQRSADGFDVIIDFAHNPDGVEQALSAAAAITAARGSGALRVVLSTLALVGRAQAHAVGRAGAAHADQLVLTTQRWTLDDAADRLPDGLLEGAREAPRGTVDVELDRAAAIERAVRAARPGDLVLILDRGDRGGTLFDPAGHARPFDDRTEVRALLASSPRAPS